MTTTAEASAYFKSLDEQGIDTPEKYRAWIDEQDDPDEALELAWDHNDQLSNEWEPGQPETSRWLVNAIDYDHGSFQFPEELREKKFDLESDECDGGISEVEAFCLECFNSLTGLDGEFPNDTNIFHDDDGRISEIDPGAIIANTPVEGLVVTFNVDIDLEDEDEELLFRYERNVLGQDEEGNPI